MADRYKWLKKKIDKLLKEIEPIKKDNLKTSYGNIWSLKKSLVLNYYSEAFVKIMRKNANFKKWYYVDTHCGSGLIRLKKDLSNEIIPGSPIVMGLNNEKYGFTNYFMSDSDEESINVLIKRLKMLNLKINKPTVQKFKNTVNSIIEKDRFGIGFLIFIDPTGYKDITWELMKKLFNIETADIFFVFMTYTINFNAEKERKNPQLKAITKFYGNENWKKCNSDKELLKLYMEQIKKLKKHVLNIPVYKTGHSKLYDIIIATRSKGGHNVLEDAKEILDDSSTEIIKEAFKVISNKSKDLDEYMSNDKN